MAHLHTIEAVGVIVGSVVGSVTGALIERRVMKVRQGSPLMLVAALGITEVGDL